MIKIENLSLRFDDFQVLNNINLHLEIGKPLVILGESGAGKSTLAKSLLGKFNQQVEGKFEFEGKNLFKLSQQEWRFLRGKKIALMVQTLADSLNPQLKVIHQLLDGFKAHKISRREALIMSENSLRANGVESHLWHKYPRTLSGGETQKILLAIALAMEPKFLILDEPTSALDAGNRDFIFQRIKQIAVNKYLLIITHSIEFAQQVADTIGVLYGGELIEIAKSEDFFAQPLHPYARALLNSAPKAESLKDLQGINGDFASQKEGCIFINRCNQALANCASSKPKLSASNNFAKKATGALAKTFQHKVACHRGGVVKALEVKNLSKKFADKKVLDNLSFDLYAGESLAIFGKSGSGKSTLAKILVGLEQADEGQILLDDKSHSKIAIVGQNPYLSLPIHFNLFQTLAEPVKIVKNHSLAKDKEALMAKISATLTMVELPNHQSFLRRSVKTLSGGELQRLALARALMEDAKILIADEITSALDVSLQAKVVKMLMQIQEKTGVALIFISHDQLLSQHLADRILYLKDGSLAPFAGIR